jgi:hypothetical protein
MVAVAATARRGAIRTTQGTTFSKGGEKVATQGKDVLKDLMVNIGILFILVGATAVKDGTLTTFLLGLALLALQTFEFKGAQGKKLVVAEILISLTVTVAAVTHLVMSSSFKAPQVFMIITLLGAILVVIEAVKKYVD